MMHPTEATAQSLRQLSGGYSGLSKLGRHSWKAFFFVSVVVSSSGSVYISQSL